MCKDTIVAVMADARALACLEDYYLLHDYYMYYLLHVTSDGVVDLSQEKEFDYVHSKGSDVLIGHFYIHQKTAREGILYKRDSKVAIIHRDSMIYVGIELSGKSNQEFYVLSCTDHEDILCSISVHM